MLRTIIAIICLLVCAARADAQQILTLGQTAHPLMFFMESTSSPGTGVTGLTPVVTLSKDGGAFASPSGAVSQVGKGWYKVAGNATDTDTNGTLILNATGTGAFEANVRFIVRDTNIYDATSMGISRLDASTSSRMATFTLPSNFSSLGISAGGKINGVILTDTLTTYTGNTLQTGDSYARLGAPAGANTSADIAAILAKTPDAAHYTNARGDNLDAAITSRMATFVLPSNFSSLGISAGGKINGLILADNLTTYTGNTPQTGDSFARLGAPVGANISADIAGVPAATLGANVEGSWTLARTQSLLFDCLVAGAASGLNGTGHHTVHFTRADGTTPSIDVELKTDGTRVITIH